MTNQSRGYYSQSRREELALALLERTEEIDIDKVVQWTEKHIQKIEKLKGFEDVEQSTLLTETTEIFLLVHNILEKRKELGIPKCGDMLYIAPGDDRSGGLATVDRVVEHQDAPIDNRYFLVFKEAPTMQHNWSYLKTQQDRLKELYGDRKAQNDVQYARGF